MYTTRYVVRPSCGRVAKMSPSCHPMRSLSSFPTQSWGYGHSPRFGGFPAAEFSGMFRVLDSLFPSSSVSPSSPHISAEARRREAPVHFTPRFDVQETEAGYELRGELPGVEGDQLNVQFTDPRTLVVSGSVSRSTSIGDKPTQEGSEPAKAQVQTSSTVTAEEQPAAAVTNDDTASVHSSGSHDSNYKRPSVEEEEYVDVGEESSADATARREATPSSSTVAGTEEASVAAAPQQQSVGQQQPTTTAAAANAGRFYYSERSVGSFSRTFSFPVNVDQDAVKASLRNGVLSIVVPRAKAPEARKILVE